MCYKKKIAIPPLPPKYYYLYLLELVPVFSSVVFSFAKKKKINLISSTENKCKIHIFGAVENKVTYNS